MTPTQRTLSFLRAQGFHSDVVERWLPRINKRRDLFHIIDIIALNGDKTIGVQSTGQDFAAHVAKLASEPGTIHWLSSPYRALLLFGWRKVKKGATVAKYHPRISEFWLESGKVQSIETDYRNLATIVSSE